MKHPREGNHKKHPYHKKQQQLVAERGRKHRHLPWLTIILVIVIGTGCYLGWENEQENLQAAALAGIPTGPVALVVSPETIIQGEPVMITIFGMTTAVPIKSATILSGGHPSASLYFTAFYENRPTSFYGVGINDRVGTSTVTVVVKNGSKKGLILTQTFLIKPRQRYVEPLPVPDQIGGNSSANQTRVASILDTENAEIAAVPSEITRAFWSKPFSFPLETAIRVTDPYGFNRDTGELTIPHKGVDFKAASGTPVYAINDGIVRVTKSFVIYGGTVIIDHGLGIESLSMHMSRIIVAQGQTVHQGDLLGYSGETGYAVGPHLHLSIKIDRVSIDPMKFFALFDTKPFQ